MALVSVIIPTHNRALKTLRAVSSVLYQTFCDFEIIVVDDGSSDNTPEVIPEAFGSRITYVRHHRNLGVSAARNTGIRTSTAALIAFIDSDDYWLPEKLALQTDFFLSNPAGVACQTGEIWVRNGLRVNPKKRHLKPGGDIFNHSLKLCLVSPSAVMLKRSVLDEVGFFDENLPACEDYDLWLRIGCRYHIDLLKQALVIKTGGHPDQLSARYSGMDRFRIKSMIKLIKAGQLNQKQEDACFNELSCKCRIYGEGCLKRGRIDEGRFYLALPKSLKQTLNHLS